MWVLACICRLKLLYCTFMYACMHVWACSNPHTPTHTHMHFMEIHYYFHTTDIQSKYKHTVQAEESQLKHRQHSQPGRPLLIKGNLSKDTLIKITYWGRYHITALQTHFMRKGKNRFFTCQEIQTGILLPTFTFLPPSGTWKCVSQEDFLNIW